MIRWIVTEDKLPAFSYYPLLEAGFGVFLMLAALTVPILFLIYNGIKAEQWAELLFCAGFFIMFMYLGKSLTFQKMHARLTLDGYHFYQSLRDPAVEHRLTRSQWLGIRTFDEKSGEETYVVLRLKTIDGELDFYKSINRKEIKTLAEELEKLHKKAEEEKQ